MFKQAAASQIDRLLGLQLDWLHADVYAQPALGLRFSLHGVPAFFFFHRGRRLGRITGWPGSAGFFAAVNRLKTQLDSAGHLETGQATTTFAV